MICSACQKNFSKKACGTLELCTIARFKEIVMQSKKPVYSLSSLVEEDLDGFRQNHFFERHLDDDGCVYCTTPGQ